MKRGLRMLVLSAAALAPLQAQPTPPVAPQAHAAPADVPEDYQLGVSDKVRIIVFNEPTLSGEFYVNANGALSLPLIGDVNARGSNPGQVAAVIQRKLADGYVKEPRVSIDVLTFRPFYILGEVTKPGEYPYSAGLTVLNAVATAQGFTYRANKKKVFIKHAGKEGSIESLSADLEVRPGDTIRVGERHF